MPPLTLDILHLRHDEYFFLSVYSLLLFFIVCTINHTWNIECVDIGSLEKRDFFVWLFEPKQLHSELHVNVWVRDKNGIKCFYEIAHFSQHIFTNKRPPLFIRKDSLTCPISICLVKHTHIFHEIHSIGLNAFFFHPTLTNRFVELILIVVSRITRIKLNDKLMFVFSGVL